MPRPWRGPLSLQRSQTKNWGGWLTWGTLVVVSALITPIFGPDLCQENKGTISSKEAPILCKA